MQHPLLHRHHLCCGSDPQRLSCLHRHHWGFLMALPADAHSTDVWRLVLNPESSSASSLYHHPWNHSGPSLLWAGVSVQLRKTAYKDLCNLAPDYFYSHFFCHILMSPFLQNTVCFSHSWMSLILEPLLAWDSCPSVCLSRWLRQGLAMPRTFWEPYWVELVGGSCCGSFVGCLMVLLSSSSLCREA